MIHIGVGSNVRILDIGTSKWSDGVLESLPALHAISGCDSVSAVNGKRQAKWVLLKRRKSICKVYPSREIQQESMQMYFKNWKIVFSSQWNARSNKYKGNTFTPNTKYAKTTSVATSKGWVNPTYHTCELWGLCMEESSRDQPWYSMFHPVLVVAGRAYQIVIRAFCCVDGKSTSPRISGWTYYLHVP